MKGIGQRLQAWATKRWQVAACLGGLLLLHGLATAYWVTTDSTLRGNDMGPHLQGIANSYTAIRQLGLVDGLAWVSHGKGPIFWPSAGYLSWAGLSLLLGHSVEGLRGYNVVFLALIIWAAYAMGRRLHSTRAGLLAAALAPLYPGVYGEARQVGMDLPCAAFTAACMALMLTTERLSHPWRCLALGLMVGLGTLTRPHINFFIALPALALLVWALVKPRQGRRGRVALNAAVTVAAALAVSAVWWLDQLGEIVREFGRHHEGTGFADQGSSFTFYLRALVLSASPLLLALGGIGLVLVALAWWRGRGHGGVRVSGLCWLVVCWFVGGLGVLSVIQVHMLRYLLPLLPAMAVLTAVGLASMQRAALRRVATAVVLLGASVAWLGDTVDLIGWPLPRVRALSLQEVHKGEPYVTAGIPVLNPYIRQLRQVEQTLGRRHPGGEQVLVRLVTHPRMDTLALRWAGAPMLKVGLPWIRITDRRFPEYMMDRRRDELHNMSSVRTPVHEGIRHCYTLRLFPSPQPPPRSAPGCRLVRQWVPAFNPTEDRRRLWLTLYHYPGCAPSVCAAEGTDPLDQ